MKPLVTVTPAGMYCERGDFYIDPWQPVATAVITHAHGDHARAGSGSYIAARESLPILYRRLGDESAIQGLDYGVPMLLGEVKVSFHPAGHVLGSAQIRLEADGEVWVVSGDYKRAADPTCLPFEVVPCDVFITEATFALPIYRWEEGAVVARDILAWWDANRAAGRASILYCYAFGKAQRILAELALITDREVFVHGAIEPLNEAYRRAGVVMLPTRPVAETDRRQAFAGELILAPPAAGGSTWVRRFGEQESAFASGWMRVRGARRRRGVDRGFVVSDHTDWPDLLRTVRETGARRVLATHGYSDTLARYLREQGIDAATLATSFEGEGDV